MTPTFETEELFCPTCNAQLSVASVAYTAGEEPHAPMDGDNSVCVYCGSILEMRCGKWLQATALMFKDYDDDKRFALTQAQADVMKLIRQGKMPPPILQQKHIRN